MARAARGLRRYALLLAKTREDILSVLDRLQSDAPEPGGWLGEEPAEAAAALSAQEENMTLREWLRQRLVEVDAALARIRTGTYGRCEVCGTPIEPGRLEAIPWVRTRMECQRLLERGVAHTDRAGRVMTVRKGHRRPTRAVR